MGLSFMVEAGDSVRDGAGESIGIGEGSVDELMLLEVAPASLDVIQLGASRLIRPLLPAPQPEADRAAPSRA